MNKDIVTVGNPNSGKTTLFNQLTGARQQVGNWAGVTVEKKTGRYSSGQHEVNITDLPGIYSLDNSDDINSLDESVAVKALFSSSADLIVNVVDASSLERSLYLTLQLRELGDPMVVVLNKIDALERHGVTIDTQKLARLLGCPVLSVSATDDKSVSQLTGELDSVLKASRLHKPEPMMLDYGEKIGSVLEEIAPMITSVRAPYRIATAIRLLTDDQLAAKSVPAQELMKIQQVISKHCAELDTDLMVANSRYTLIADICCRCRQQVVTVRQRLTDTLDTVVLHRYLGLPIFLGVMYLMFMLSLNLGNALTDFFDIGVGGVLVNGGHALMDGHLPQWLVTLLADGIGGGIRTVSTFIPVIACLYLFMSVLESSGYMARAAFVLDRVMQKIGLPGKAFVPLVLGFGCNVPAIMATRTLEQERERKVAAAMAPFMSCGARLPVYTLFAASFFQASAQNIIFILYLAGILVAIITGVMLRNTLYPGESECMVMEIPEYEMPTVKNVMLKTWNKLKRFVLGAGKTIVVVVTLLSFAQSIGTDGSFGHQDSGDSVLAKAAQTITPVFKPIGIEQDNWQATVGIITGIFAKESVVGTLNSLYSQSSNSDEPFDLWATMVSALQTIPHNIAALDFTDPLKVSVDASEQGVMNDQGVDSGVFTALQQKFSPSSAFAYLVFILLYTPCVAAMGAYVREFGRQFATFIGGWTMLQAVVFSTLAYQVLNLTDDPALHAAWIGASLSVLLVSYVVMRQVKCRWDEKDVLLK
ncbi:Fe(2+) transporter permease subunit FeoB [Veronia pacifica]|uniref:Ferrous iron transport protein B n=1 Tax=Veronia pacifica TaxID=1080227 RepID=A0A1C3EF13_9GAMM|nr:Fe(2+) transporter permease subunit FeoB [Veronia pacifica]ODA31837.1 ferrous iron transport protein B [Veronia pacifica]